MDNCIKETYSKNNLGIKNAAILVYEIKLPMMLNGTSGYKRKKEKHNTNDLATHCTTEKNTFQYKFSFQMRIEENKKEMWVKTGYEEYKNNMRSFK
jgi:hypothetical protein